MKDKLLEQTKHEYKPKQRIIALLVMAPIFLIVLPFILISLGSRIDQWMQWTPILNEPFNHILGWLLIMAGGIFGFWSIYIQFTLGRGTPVPIMATQKLIIRPPYSYCRNPMAFGAILMYLGVTIVFASMGGTVLVMLGSGFLLAYIKRIEEREMDIRFGQDYLDYKKRTPFLIPRYRKQN